MLNFIYFLLAGGVLAFYAVSEYSGWEYGNPTPRTVSVDARRSPGWSRHITTHHFYSGFRGGK